MNRVFALTLVVLLFCCALGFSPRSSASVVREPMPYNFQESPTPTPVPSPSPSPNATPTPVPEPEPVPSPTPTPFNHLI